MFSSSNKPFNEKALKKFIKSTIGIRPKQIDLYKQSLTHKSINAHNNYERLEFLGDAILSSIIAQYLFEKYPNKQEGELTQLLSSIVNRRSLNKIGERIMLGEYVTYIETPKGHKNLLGNALEAFIGAIYLDKGLKKTKRVIINQLIIPFIDFDKAIEQQLDYKSKLIIWSQQNKVAIDFKSSEIDEGYQITLIVGGKELTKSIAKSKKEAEKIVSKKVFSSNVLDQFV